MKYLGCTVPKYGNEAKRGVMAAATAPINPKFNRMSGIQEFTNAIFLFVNKDGPLYENVLSTSSGTITLYGQATQVSYYRPTHAICAND